MYLQAPAPMAWKRLSTIVLGTDGSRPAARAIAVTADLAHAVGGHVDVVAAWQGGPMRPAPSAAGGEAAAARWARLARGELERRGVRSVTGHVVEGAASRRVTERAEHVAADLVVLGGRGRGSPRATALGSTAQEVVRTSSKPVLLARGGRGSWPPERVVAGHDGSGHAHDAARLAAILARALDVPLVLAGVVAGDDEVAAGATAALLASAATRLADLVGAVPSVLVTSGDPTGRLVDLSREVPTLLALGGGRGAQEFADGRPGGIAANVVVAATGPVLVVPAGRRHVF